MSGCQSGIWKSSSSSFGESYSDLLAFRSPDVLYSNTTGRYLFVSISATSSSNAARYMYVFVNGTQISTVKTTEASATGYQRMWSNVSFVVPPGGTYQVTHNGGLELRQWVEM